MCEKDKNHVRYKIKKEGKLERRGVRERTLGRDRDEEKERKKEESEKEKKNRDRQIENCKGNKI